MIHRSLLVCLVAALFRVAPDFTDLKRVERDFSLGVAELPDGRMLRGGNDRSGGLHRGWMRTGRWEFNRGWVEQSQPPAN